MIDADGFQACFGVQGSASSADVGVSPPLEFVKKRAKPGTGTNHQAPEMTVPGVWQQPPPLE